MKKPKSDNNFDTIRFQSLPETPLSVATGRRRAVQRGRYSFLCKLCQLNDLDRRLVLRIVFAVNIFALESERHFALEHCLFELDL